MRKYRVPTICRDTGEESYIVVNASSAQDAMKAVQAVGFISGIPEVISTSHSAVRSDNSVVNSGSAHRPLPRSARRPSLPVLVLAGLGAIGLVSCILVLLARQLDSSRDQSRASLYSSESPHPEAADPPFGPATTATLPDNSPSPSPALAGASSAEQVLVPAAESPSAADEPLSRPVVLAGDYMSIPITGEVGKDVLTSGIEQCLQRAVSEGIHTIVFDIDSPGGSVAEAYKILEVLEKYDLTMVARVRHAISAAMVFVAASDTILVEPDSTLGGAVAFSLDRATGEVAVDAKLLSIWGASLAATAAAHNHNTAVVWAMCVMERSVYVHTDTIAGRTTVQDFPCSTTADCRLLDGPSTVLTLDGQEAIKLGFALPATGGQQLAFASDFRERLSGRTMMEAAASSRRQQTKERLERQIRQVVDRERVRRESEEQERERRRQALEVRRQYESDVTEIRGLVLRIEAYINDARAKHPRQYSDYATDYRGNYTRTSIDNWRYRSAQATQAWKNVKAGLEDIAKRMEAKGLDKSEPALKAVIERLYDDTNLELNRLANISSYPQ